MLSAVTLASLAAAASLAQGAVQGFNYGATAADGTVQTKSDFEADFKAAQQLAGTDGAFTAARLYTMIQGGTDNTPIEAIDAAISTNTKLLLTLWASAGEGQFNQELTALKNAINNYGDKLKDLVVGISVGSEDLYRDSEMGKKANAGIGIGPDTLVTYIKEVRDLISGSPIESAPIGHVDTWTAWVNGTVTEVIDNVDWLGFDIYPYFQNTMENSIDVAKQLYTEGYEKTVGVAQGKPIWITETGWPVSGPQERDAVASKENAKTYWDEVGCPLFGNENVFWYTLKDTGASPSFGVVGSDNQPLFDLKCSNKNSTSSASSSAPASSAAASSVASANIHAASSAGSADPVTVVETVCTQEKCTGHASSAAATGAASAASGAAGAASGAATGAAVATSSAGAAGHASSAAGAASSHAGQAGAASSGVEQAQTSAAQATSGIAQTNGAGSQALSFGVAVAAVAAALF